MANVAEQEFNPVTADYSAARERLAKLLAPYANKPLTRQQKVEKIATEFFDGDMGSAETFMRGAEVRDDVLHEKLTDF